jgi:hypothetical protein
MQETPTPNTEDETPGSYYYDDSTGYHRFDPDAPDDEEPEGTADETALTPGYSES